MLCSFLFVAIVGFQDSPFVYFILSNEVAGADFARDMPKSLKIKDSERVRIIHSCLVVRGSNTQGL